MMTQNPKVSIGLAVFNGEKYLMESINSILAQTFTDFELIISDNASTDITEEICRKYAKEDARISYHRNSTNIGGVNNENLTFKLSQGQYFRLAAHDDVLDPDLLAKCVEILDKESDVVLCHTKTVRIDEYGKSLGNIDRNIGNSINRLERFKQLSSFEHGCETSYGLIRADILSRIELQPNYTDSDRAFLCELSLYGRFYQIPEFLFYRREHPEKSTHAYFGWYERMAWFHPSVSNNELQLRATCPYWKRIFHYSRIILRAPLNFQERSSCYIYILRYLLWENNSWIGLVKEVIWLVLFQFVRLQKIFIKD